MVRRLALVAAVVTSLVPAGSSALAQVRRGANPLQYNNPTNQAGMYGGSSVLRYNSPLNQAGMYGNNAVLRYNNPLNQAGMYGGNSVLWYNNPLAQAGMYNYAAPLRYNNPLAQANMYSVGGGYARGRTPVANGNAGANVRRRPRGQTATPAVRARVSPGARRPRGRR